MMQYLRSIIYNNHLSIILIPLIGAIIFLLMGRLELFAGVLLLWQVPLLFLVSLKIRGRFDLTSYIRLLILYNTYYGARLAVILN